jgi:hypothetical protein
MAKALLLSVVIAMIAIPVFAARDHSPRRGLKKTLFLIAVFNLFYLFAVRYIYPHLV